MSFGGGRDSYTLEYIIKVVNQGGTGGISQVNSGLRQVDTGVKQLTVSQEKLVTAQNKVQQAGLGVTKAAKGMAFGFLGITTAGAEAVGMFSMYSQVQTAVKEAQNDLNVAIKEYGKDSNEATRASRELADANRWNSMVTRNLMLSFFDLVPFVVLSINGMLKLRTALAEARKAKQELAAMNKILAGSEGVVATANKASNASFLTTSKSAKSLTTVNKALTASNLSHNGSLITSIPLLSRQRAEMGKLATTTTKLSGAMRVLSIAMKIALPLIGLEIISQAIAHNWGGFRDFIEQARVGLEKMIPALKPVIDFVWKLGESIAAIFTGDFEKIGSIWSGASKGVQELGKRSDEAEKKLQELRDTVSEFQEVGTQLLVDVSQGDKGEQRDLLKSLGIKGNEKEKMRDVLDAVEDAYKETQQAASKLEALQGFSILEKLGFDIPDDVIEDIQNTLDSDLRDIISGDNDPFNKLADILEESPDKEAYGETLKKWVTENPGLLEALRKFDPRLASAIDAWIAQMEVEAQAELDKMLLKFPDTVIDIDPNTLGQNVQDVLGITGADKVGGDKPGIFDNLISSIETGIKDLSTAIKEADWKAIGAEIRTQLDTVITVENAQRVGQLIRIYIVDPAYAVAYGLGAMVRQGIQDGWEQFKKDPIGSTLGTANMIGEPMANFVVGLLGYNSESEMYNDWQSQISNVLFSDNQTMLDLRRIIQDPVGGLIAILQGGHGTKSRFDTAPGSGQVSIGSITKGKNLGEIIGQWFDREIIQPISTAYTNFINNPIVSTIGKLLNDPIGFLIETIKGPESRFKGAMSPSDAVKMRGGGENEILNWLNTNLINPIINGIKSAETSLLNTYNGLTELGKKIVDFFRGAASKLDIFNALFNTASATSGDISTTTNQDAIDITITATDNGSAETIRKAFGSALQDIYDTMQDLLNQWSDICADIAQNAKDACEGIRDEFGSALQDVYDTMEDLANQWSRFCNSMIANAKSAAKGINKALDSIEDEEVVIRYRVEGAPQAKGGLLSMAEGGIMSAASGKLLTTYGPQLFEIGDNPGGRESIWAIPHNNPGPTVAKIDRMYKPRGGSDGGLTMFNGNFSFNISGNDIINDVKIRRKIRAVNSENMDRYG